MGKRRDLVKGFTVLMVCWTIGEGITKWLALPLAGSLIGLMVLCLGLVMGIIKLEWVEECATQLHKNLVLVFIPAAVGIKYYWPLLLNSGLTIIASIIVSTFVVLLCTAKTVEFLQKEEGQEHA